MSRAGSSTPWKEILCPLNRELSRPQSWSGRLGEQKNLLSLPGFQRGIVQSVTKSLRQLLCSENTIKFQKDKLHFKHCTFRFNNYLYEYICILACDTE
jgi:hypothetical protein